MIFVGRFHHFTQTLNATNNQSTVIIQLIAFFSAFSLFHSTLISIQLFSNEELMSCSTNDLVHWWNIHDEDLRGSLSLRHFRCTSIEQSEKHKVDGNNNIQKFINYLLLFCEQTTRNSFINGQVSNLSLNANEYSRKHPCHLSMNIHIHTNRF